MLYFFVLCKKKKKKQVWFQNKRSKERRLKQLTSMGLRPYFGASRKLRGFPVSPGLDDGSGVGVGGFNPYFDPKYAADFSYGTAPGPHPGHPSTCILIHLTLFTIRTLRSVISSDLLRLLRNLRKGDPVPPLVDLKDQLETHPLAADLVSDIIFFQLTDPHFLCSFVGRSFLLLPPQSSQFY